MNKFTFMLLFVTCVHGVAAQNLPLKQSFEEAASDNWNFTTNPAAYNSDGDIWDRVNDGGQYFSPAPEGAYFWEFYDIDSIPGIAQDEKANLIFDTVDISGEDACTLSFCYCNRGLDSTDYMSYTVVFDNSNNWDSSSEVILPKHEESQSTWHTEYIFIPAEMQYCRLRLSAKANYSADCGGFDNIQLQTGTIIVPEISIETPLNNSFYENNSTNITISGTSTNATGMIVWSNALNDTFGEIAATSAWSIADIVLGEGENRISINATNSNGKGSSESITLLRGISLQPDGPGTVAFVAFNSGGDSFAFTPLKNLAAGTVIRFCDEEWNGIAFTSATGEDDLVWSNETEIAAGTVVEFYACHSASTISNNIGDIASGYLSLSQSGEGIIAYCGSEQRKPETFLAAINTANENLQGTGLKYGEHAVYIPSATLSQFYIGERSTEETWNGYLPLINNPANWTGTEGLTKSWGDSTAFSLVKAGTVMLVE